MADEYSTDYSNRDRLRYRYEPIATPDDELLAEFIRREASGEGYGDVGATRFLQGAEQMKYSERFGRSTANERALLDKARGAQENYRQTAGYDFGQSGIEALEFEMRAITERINAIGNRAKAEGRGLTEAEKAEQVGLKRRRDSLDEASKQAIERDALTDAYGNLVGEAETRYGESIDRGRQMADEGGRDLGLATDSYRRMLLGEEPSMAELQLARGTDQAIRNATAAATSGRGNQALALAQAADNAAIMSQDAARQAAMIRMQEQEGARNALLNAGIQRENTGLNVAFQGQDRIMDQANISTDTAMGLRTEKTQRADQQRQLNWQRGINIASGIVGATGGLVGEFAKLGKSSQPGDAPSDVNAKKNIKPGGGEALKEAAKAAMVEMGLVSDESSILSKADRGAADLRDGLNNSPALRGLGVRRRPEADLLSQADRGAADLRDGLGVLDMLKDAPPYEYDYRDPNNAQHSTAKKHTGVMAQDLEKTALGSRFVREDETGTKRVDYQAMAPALAAGLSELNQQVEKLKAGVGAALAPVKKGANDRRLREAARRALIGGE